MSRSGPLSIRAREALTGHVLEERRKTLDAHLEAHGMLPEEYAEEALSEIDALRAELTAARTVGDGEVAETIKLLRDGSCSDEALAELLVRLSAAKAEAERERDEARDDSNGSHESFALSERARVELSTKLAKAERERDSARADALEEAAKWHDQRADHTPDAMAIGIHRRSAAAIRALKPTPTLGEQ